jgi:hypothetical protein
MKLYEGLGLEESYHPKHPAASTDESGERQETQYALDCFELEDESEDSDDFVVTLRAGSVTTYTNNTYKRMVEYWDA